MSAEVRDRIVGSADALFRARGFQAVGMDELRSAADVTLRRMYAEFASKEQLILAVLGHWHDNWTAGLARSVAAVGTPHERLLAVFDHLREWSVTSGSRGNGFVLAVTELGASSPLVAAAARAHDDSFRREVADLVEAAGLPAALGPQLCLVAEGVQATTALDERAGAAEVGRSIAARLIETADRLA